MVIKVGIIGLSDGNGHPFSFSAIINGYDALAFADAGWPTILAYLNQQPANHFGIDGVRVTHAWTQDAELTKRLCAACLIDTACRNVSDMLGQVDALIIARDDWKSHFGLAIPFLMEGVPVFIDKPLTLDADELDKFQPYLESAKLMSCSGMRYSQEIYQLRISNSEIGDCKLIAGVVLNDLEKYGVHLIEAIFGLGNEFSKPIAVTRLDTPHDSFVIQLKGGVPFYLDCLGDIAKTFHLNIYGDSGHLHFDLHDNFTAFRRTLEKFFQMIRTEIPAINPDETLCIMKLLIAARSIQVGEVALLNA
jgi:hypothetical protein